METDIIIFQCNDGYSVKIPHKFTDKIEMVQEMEPDIFPFEISLEMYSSGPVSFIVDFAIELSINGSFTINHTSTYPEDKPSRTDLVFDDCMFGPSNTTESSHVVAPTSLEMIGFPNWASTLIDKLTMYEKCQVLELANFLRFGEMETILIAAIGNDIRNLPDNVFTDTFQLKTTISTETSKEIISSESWAFTSPSLQPGASLSRETVIPLTETAKEEYNENIPMMGVRGIDDLSKGLLLLPANVFRHIIENV